MIRIGKRPSGRSGTWVDETNASVPITEAHGLPLLHLALVVKVWDSVVPAEANASYSAAIKHPVVKHEVSVPILIAVEPVPAETV